MKTLLAFIAGAGLALVPAASAAPSAPTPTLTNRQQTRIILRQQAELCKVEQALRLGGVAKIAIAPRCLTNRATT